jgi:hypothetical protein
MSYIGRMQSISFDRYKAPSPLGFIMQHNLHYIASGSLILTGLVITLFTNPHLVTHSVFFLGLSIGRARSKFLFLFLQSRKST